MTMSDETPIARTNRDGRGYASADGPKIDAAMAALVDDRAPEFRTELADLLKAAYRAGLYRGLAEEARKVVLDTDLPDELTSKVNRALWEEAQDDADKPAID